MTQDQPPATVTSRQVLAWVDLVDGSPLYTALGRITAAEPRLMEIVAQLTATPPMNVFLGAIKFHLQPDDALAAYYPHLTAARTPDAKLAAIFTDHVLKHRDQILATALNRTTQTNEVGRCAAILPWLSGLAARLTVGEPDTGVHAVEVGSSAGLNLCLDHYTYEYTGLGAGCVGAAAREAHQSAVVLRCENRGGFGLPLHVPRIESRTGIDLNPIDASDPDQLEWLEALVWPEHLERHEALRAAARVRATLPVTQIAGDAAEHLWHVHRELPPGPMLIWHTVMLYQLDQVTRSRLDDAIAAIAAQRPVARLGMESLPGTPWQEIRVGLPGVSARWDDMRPVAIAQSHGRWIDALP